MPLKGYLSETKYNIRLSIPIIIGLLGHTFVAFIDTIMVGQLGTAELAAVSLGSSFIFIVMSLSLGFSLAITPLTAEADASKNIPRGISILKNGLVLCFLNGIICLSIVFFSSSFLWKMNQPDEVVRLAIPFLDIATFSLLPVAVFQGFKQFTDGMSSTKYAMYATLFGNVLNIILDYLLIFGKFGFPKLDIVGAAIATLISRIGMVLFMWSVIRWGPKFKLYLKALHFKSIQWVVIKKIITLGIPSAIQILSEVLLFSGTIWISGMIGKNPQAANQIALNLSSMTFMVAMGLSTTAMVRVGNQKGLLNYDRMRRVAFSLFALTFIIDVIFALFFFTFNYALPKLYLNENDMVNFFDNREVLWLSSKLLIIAGFFQIFDGMQVVILGALRGLQDVKIPTIISFVCYILVGISTSYILGIHSSLGINGVWVGLLVGLSLASCLLFLRFNKQSKRFLKLNKYTRL